MADDTENQIEMFSQDQILAKDFLALNANDPQQALLAACQLLIKMNEDKHKISNLVSSGMIYSKKLG